MKQRKQADILGCHIDIVSMQAATQMVEQLVDQGTPSHIITLNAEIAYVARDNQKLRNIINKAALVTPDGIGVVWAAQKLGYGIRERVTGIDMIYKICELAARRQWKIYFLGAAPGIAQKAAENLASQYPGFSVAGCRDGYFLPEDIPALLKDIKASQPHILLVALGAPKQEFWIDAYQRQLRVPVCIGVGGSFDVLAGTKKRAPEIMIKLNLEWLYRLLAEPSRIKRQMVLPKFALAVLRQRLIERG
ncbi:MAG: WecB/TagA/CpsF family glycosyltransferase [Syntrophomonadaceae bacterium]|jgi:N-acetylglucosaminyldiphosphoundecaprenol N-acetyl-beta-D-mannosaminyltransferase